jgi:hypothetical protein
VLLWANAAVLAKAIINAVASNARKLFLIFSPGFAVSRNPEKDR